MKLVAILAGALVLGSCSLVPQRKLTACADPNNPCRLPNAMASDPPLNQVITHTVEAGVRGLFTESVAWNVGVFVIDSYWRS